MPRTTFVLPTSTTRRLDIENRLLRHDEIAGADSQNLIAISKKRAALLVDADPRPGRCAVADDARDAIAGLVDCVLPPLAQNRQAIERSAEAAIEMLNEGFGGSVDAPKLFTHLA